MIALVILIIALGPALILTTTALNASTSIKNNMIAANLAQEGVEVVRSIRDENWLRNLAFDNGLSDGTYRVQWNSQSLLAISDNPLLKIKVSNQSHEGTYSYESGTDTIFRRRIIIAKQSSTELLVRSEITWQERGTRSKYVMVESRLFNWK